MNISSIIHVGIIIIFHDSQRQTFSMASWSCPACSSVTSDVKGKLNDWMLVSPGFFIVTIAHSLASDNCACHEKQSHVLSITALKLQLQAK